MSVEIKDAIDAFDIWMMYHNEYPAIKNAWQTLKAELTQQTTNTARDEICPHFIIYNKGGSGEFGQCDCAGKLLPIA